MDYKMFIYQIIINIFCKLSKLITFVRDYFIYNEWKNKSIGNNMSKRILNVRKAIQALNYLSTKQQNGIMSKMKAYKLLCLADKYHIRQYGRSITDDIYCALPKGTVPSNIMSLLTGESTVEEFGENIEILDQNEYKSKSEPNLKVFSETDLEVLDLILEKFNDKDQYWLSEHSHKFPEWKRYESKLKDESKKNSYIVKDIDFFKNTPDESGLFVDDEELLSLTKDLYTNN